MFTNSKNLNTTNNTWTQEIDTRTEKKTHTGNNNGFQFAAKPPPGTLGRPIKLLAFAPPPRIKPKVEKSSSNSDSTIIVEKHSAEFSDENINGPPEISAEIEEEIRRIFTKGLLDYYHKTGKSYLLTDFTIKQTATGVQIETPYATQPPPSEEQYTRELAILTSQLIGAYKTAYNNRKIVVEKHSGIEKPTKVERKEDRKSVGKNYAPLSFTTDKVVHDEFTKDMTAHLSKMKLERKERWKNNAKEQKTAIAPTTQKFDNDREIKRKRREFYKQRTLGRPVVRAHYLKHSVDLTVDERLAMYSRHHKCKHAMWFNMLETKEFRGKPYCFEPTCRHDGRIVEFCQKCENVRARNGYSIACSHEKCTLNCPNCGSQYYHYMEEPDCICKILSCSRCGKTTYSVDNIEHFTCQCGRIPRKMITKTKKLPSVFSTKPEKQVQKWKVMEVEAQPIEKIPEEKPKQHVKRANFRGKKSVPLKDFIMDEDLIHVEKHGAKFSFQKQSDAEKEDQTVTFLQKLRRSLVEPIMSLKKRIAENQDKARGISRFVQMMKLVDLLEKMQRFAHKLLDIAKKNKPLVAMFVMTFIGLCSGDSVLSISSFITGVCLIYHTVDQYFVEKNSKDTDKLEKFVKKFPSFIDRMEKLDGEIDDLSSDDVVMFIWYLDEIRTTVRNPKIQEFIQELEMPLDDAGINKHATDENGKTNGFTAFISSLFGMTATAQKIFSSNTVAYMKNFNTFFSAGKNLGTMFSKVINYLPRFVQDVLCAFDTRYWLSVQAKRKDSVLSRLMLNITALHLGTENAAVSSRLKREGIALYKEFETQMAEKGLLYEPEVHKMMGMLKSELYSPLRASPRDKEPFVIRISGAPGTGKSTFWPLIISPLKPGKSIDEITKDTYVRNPTDEYFDGYLDDVHDTVLYDDFGQARTELDVAELISLVSKAVFIPPRSSIDPKSSETTGVKGQSVAPKFVILCTNSLETHPTTINCSEAVNRRKHLTIHVTGADTFRRTHKMDDLLFTYSDDPLVTTTAIMSGSGMKMGAGVEGLRELQAFVLKTYLSYAIVRKGINADLSPLLFEHKDADKEALLNVEKQAGDEHVVLNEIVPEFSEQIQHEESMYRRLKERATALWNLVHENGCGLLARLSKLGCLSIKYFVLGYRVFSGVVQGMWTVVKAIMCGAFLYSLYNCMTKKNDVVKETEIEKNSATTRTPVNTNIPRIMVHAEPIPENPIPIPVTKHSGLDVARRFLGNMIRVNVDGLTVSGIFLQGRIFLTSRHVFRDRFEEKYIDGKRMVIVYATRKEKTDTFFERDRLQEIFYDDGKLADMVLYRMDPTQTAAFPTLTQHLWNGNLMLQGRRVVVPKMSVDQEKSYTRAMVTRDNLEVTYSMEMCNGVTAKHKTFEYDALGEAGDCGSPILIDDPSIQHTFVGIHTGGCEGQSYAFHVTRKMVDVGLEAYKEVIRATIHSAYIELGDDRDNNLPGCLHKIGKLTHGITQSSKTTIRHSPLHGKISEPTTMPAILNPTDSRLDSHLVYKQLEKYSLTPRKFNQKTIDIAVASIGEELRRHKAVCIKRKLTEEESINGVENMPFLGAIDGSTSAGFPSNMKQETRGPKRKLFQEIDGKFVVSDPILRETLDQRKELMEKNELPYSLWTVTLKDERRPIEKALAGKTRIFTGGPLDFILTSRQYCLAFVAFFYQICGKSFSAVGINKYSLAFHGMVSRMKEVGQRGFDGDYSNWDGSVHYEILLGAMRVIDDWYGDEHTDKRMLLAQELAQCLHVYKDEIYMVNHALPSGSDLTTVLNTIMNELLMRIAWIEMAPPEFKDIHYYNRYVRTCIYGDDLNVAVADIMLGFFNQTTITKFLAHYDITMTDGDKTGIYEDSKPIMDFVFLKNNFGMLHNFYVPLMNKQSNLESLNWIRKNALVSADQLCEMNCNNVLRNCYFYGRAYFDEIRKKILEHKPEYDLLSYYSLDYCFLELGKIGDDTNSSGHTSMAYVFP